MNRLFTWTFILFMAFTASAALYACDEYPKSADNSQTSEGDTIVTVIIYPDGSTDTATGPDRDGDGIVDEIDTCPDIKNPNQGCDDCPSTCNLTLRDYIDR